MGSLKGYKTSVGISNSDTRNNNIPFECDYYPGVYPDSLELAERRIGRETLREYTSGVNKYKFTEKERDTETAYDYFGARYYNNKLGVWLSVDPLAEKYPGWNPYNYTKNNPVVFYDPDGREIRYKGTQEEQKRQKEIVAKIEKTLAGKEIVNELSKKDGKDTYIQFGELPGKKTGDIEVIVAVRTDKISKAEKATFRSTIITLDDKKQGYSSVRTLSHELLHSYQHKTNTQYYYDKGKEEENNNVTGDEKESEKDARKFSITVEKQSNEEKK